MEDDKTTQPMRMDSIQSPDENSEQKQNQWRRYAAFGSMCGFLVCMVYAMQAPSAGYQALHFGARKLQVGYGDQALNSGSVSIHSGPFSGGSIQHSAYYYYYDYGYYGPFLGSGINGSSTGSGSNGSFAINSANANQGNHTSIFQI